MKPYDFKWTQFYETNSDFLYLGLLSDLAENELIICSTVIDADHYSILTTQRLITKESGQLGIGALEGAIDKSYGDLKDYRDKKISTFGQIQLKNGQDMNYFIETGRASMVMVQGVRTLIGTTKMTSQQVEKVTRIWNTQNEK